MNKKIIIVASLMILATPQTICDQIITFFFKPYPKAYDENKIIKKINKLTRPEKQAQYAIESTLNNYITSGIFCEYNGYLAISDLNGQVIFPRRHTTDMVNILVTDTIFPVFMLRNTISHWEIEKGIIAKMYQASRRKDRTIDTHYWEVKEVPLPENRIIDIRTIVVLAKPKYIFMPEGITITPKNIQLHLPDIYVKKGIDKTLASLYTFGIKNLFKSMDFIYKKGTKRYSQIMRDVEI